MSDATPGVTIYYTTNGSTPTTSSTRYSAPITISTNTTLQAIATGNGYGSSSEAYGVYQIMALTPTFSLASGTYNTAQTVTMSDATPGVTIYYTTNGSTPTASSTKYTGAITVSTNTTLQAIAAGNGYGTSYEAYGVYQIAVPAPTFSLKPGSYSGPQSITLSDTASGMTIYYTTNGSTPTTSSSVYKGPITISTTTTLQAIASGNGYAASSVSSGVYQIATAATPTFSLSPGSYSGPQSVSISDSSPGVTIYYTTNGSTPTTSSPVYRGPIAISTTTTVYAIASGNGYPTSSVGGGTYTITTAVPTFSPGSGNYNTPQTVTMSDATPGATIYYTTNGSTPTTSSPKYTGPITISTNTTLQAIAAGNGYGASYEAYGVYQITALTPSFSLSSGTYNTPQTVTMSDATPGVTIYYTTNGSTPTTSSPEYTAPITISTNTTLQAIAAGNGYGASYEAYGVYQITALTPSFSLSFGDL